MIQDAFVVDLLKLPSHLQLTLRALKAEGLASADQIARKTQRARAVESAYLNQFVVMGLAKKFRDGRHCYFIVTGEEKDGTIQSKEGK